MMQAEAEVSRGRRGRRLSERMAKPSSGSGASVSKVMDDGQLDKSPGHSVDCAVSGTNRIPVTFWMPDGSCYEGTAPHVAGEVLFVESNRLVPVGTEVTIRLTSPNEVSLNWGVAEGAVVWNCPVADQFKNREGFGVCLQGCWPAPTGPIGTEYSKEAV